MKGSEKKNQGKEIRTRTVGRRERAVYIPL